MLPPVTPLQGRAALQPVSAALVMNPKERALYLKQKHTNVLLPDDEATVASATSASLRSFLRQASTCFLFLYPSRAIPSYPRVPAGMFCTRQPYPSLLLI